MCNTQVGVALWLDVPSVTACEQAHAMSQNSCPEMPHQMLLVKADLMVSDDIQQLLHMMASAITWHICNCVYAK